MYTMYVHKSSNPMPKTPYLLLSPHGIFHFRLVPTRAMREFRPDLPSEIRISLRTRDRREAVLKSHFLAYHYQSAAMGIKIKTGDYPSLIHTLTDAQGRTHTIDFEAHEADAALKIIQSLTGEPETVLVQPAEPKTTRPGRSPRLSVVIAEYGEAAKLKSWDYEQGPALREFREFSSVQAIMGQLDTYVGSLSDQMVRRYREKLVKTPSGTRSLRDYWANNPDSTATPASPKTANKKLSHVRGFLKWAYRQQYIKGDLAPLLYDEKTTASKGYLPFTADELKSIFESDFFIKPKASYSYWVPLLSLYMGCRENELCQLFVRDVREYDNPELTMIPDEHKDLPKPMCLHITEEIDPADQKKLSDGERKKLKNPAAKRWVPLHPKLVELGFIDFVESCRKAGQVRLFPELLYDKKNAYGRYMGRDFTELLDELKIHVLRKKVFHSLRSNFNVAMQLVSAPDEVREKLMGHTPQSVNRSNYGNVLNPWEGLKWMGKIEYEMTHPPYKG